jgi:hypothetical protein
LPLRLNDDTKIDSVTLSEIENEEAVRKQIYETLYAKAIQKDEVFKQRVIENEKLFQKELDKKLINEIATYQKFIDFERTIENPIDAFVFMNNSDGIDFSKNVPNYNPVIHKQNDSFYETYLLMTNNTASSTMAYTDSSYNYNDVNNTSFPSLNQEEVENEDEEGFIVEIDNRMEIFANKTAIRLRNEAENALAIDLSMSGKFFFHLFIYLLYSYGLILLLLL